MLVNPFAGARPHDFGHRTLVLKLATDVGGRGTYTRRR